MFLGINISFKQYMLDLEKQLRILNIEPCDFPKATIYLLITTLLTVSFQVQRKEAEGAFDFVDSVKRASEDQFG
jgi:hypothetical protein